MGKMILCSGTRTDKPFVSASTGTRIYSIEELCYSIEQQIFFVDKEMFSDSLIEWIRTELNLPQRADKLKLLKENNADLKTLVTAVLCSSDYYTEPEIKAILKKVDEIGGLTPIKRNILRAKQYLEKEQYAEAAGEYERLLKSKDSVSLTPEEYGDILHNLAVAKVHSKGIKEASKVFKEAYGRNHREESLRQYLFTVSLTEESSYGEAAAEYAVSEETGASLTEELMLLNEEASQYEGMKQIEKLRRYKAHGQRAVYDRLVRAMINQWMTQYRRGM